MHPGRLRRRETMDDSELFSSPAKADPSQLEEGRNRKGDIDNDDTNNPRIPTNHDSRFNDAEEVREAALRRELEGVRNINEVIEGVIGTLERARGNMNVRLK